MAQVRWWLTAGNDLRDIEDFIARDSALHAITLVDRIIEAAETLLKNTHLGRVVPEFSRSEKFCSEGIASSIFCKMTTYSFFESSMARGTCPRSSAENLGTLVTRKLRPFRGVWPSSFLIMRRSRTYAETVRSH